MKVKYFLTLNEEDSSYYDDEDIRILSDKNISLKIIQYC